MARRPRVDDGWNHVINRGVDRAIVFPHDRDRLTFEKLMGQLADGLGIEVHAYCLMGNHYHLLVYCPHGGLSTFMQQLSSSYTRITNDRLGRDGPLFRGRFHSVPIRSELQIVRTAAYIHRNPIDLVPEAALTASRWSTYGVYLGRRSAPSWLTRTTVDALLPPDLHRRLVAEPLEPPTAVEVTTADIDSLVAGRVDPQCPRGKQIRLLLGFELSDLSAADIAAWIGLTSAGAVRAALSRAKSARCASPGFEAIVTDLGTQLRGAM